MAKEPRPSLIGKRLAIDGRAEWGEGPDARQVSAKVAQWNKATKGKNAFYHLNCDDDTTIEASREFVERYMLLEEDQSSSEGSEEEDDDGGGTGEENLDEEEEEEDEEDEESTEDGADDLQMLAAAAATQDKAMETPPAKQNPESSKRGSSRLRGKAKEATPATELSSDDDSNPKGSSGGLLPIIP